MTVKLAAVVTGNLGEQTYEVLVDALMKGALHAGDRSDWHVIFHEHQSELLS